MVYKGFKDDQGTPQTATPRLPSVKPLTKKEQCSKDGGHWDELTQTCVQFNKGGDSKTKQPQQKTIISEEDRRSLPDGANIITDRFGNERIQTREDVEARQAGFSEHGQPTMLDNLKAEDQRQIQLQQSLSQLGSVNPNQQLLQQMQQADVDWGQALTAGTIGAAPSILGSAATGAAAGVLAGGGITPLAPILGAVGAAVGIWRGIQGNIKEQQKGEIGATTADLAAGQLKMRQYAMAASRDPYHADKYIQLYNNEKTKLYYAQRQLQLEVSGNLNKWMDDGRVQLAKYDDFLEAGGISDVYEDKLRVSIMMNEPLMPEELD